MQIPPAEFEQLVQQAYWQLPDSVRSALGNLDIIVEDTPGPESEGAIDPHDHGHTLLGLYVGVPLPERHLADPLLPDCYLSLPPAHHVHVRLPPRCYP